MPGKCQLVFFSQVISSVDNPKLARSLMRLALLWVCTSISPKFQSYARYSPSLPEPVEGPEVIETEPPFLPPTSNTTKGNSPVDTSHEFSICDS